MITLTREEAQQVLDALKCIYNMDKERIHHQAIAILRARLSAPEPEPVAWMSSSRHIYHSKAGAELDGVDKVVSVYVHPPKEWQGLTDEEIRQTTHHKVDGAYDYSFKQGARWAEAKLKEKNA
jgi:hypothetical protein